MAVNMPKMAKKGILGGSNTPKIGKIAVDHQDNITLNDEIPILRNILSKQIQIDMINFISYV